MSVNRTVAAARPSTLFAMLIDPATYPNWVMGTAAMRGWDNNWPELGSCFHHRVGLKPIVIDDNSEVLIYEQDARLVLEVRIRPLGVGVVDVQLEPLRGGESTLITMTEETIGGWFDRVPERLLDPLLWARNAVSLRRLARLAEAKEQLVEENPGEVTTQNA